MNPIRPGTPSHYSVIGRYPSGLFIRPNRGSDFYESARSALASETAIPNRRIVLNAQDRPFSVTAQLRDQLQGLAEECGITIGLKITSDPWALEFEPAERVEAQLRQGALAAIGLHLCLEVRQSQRLVHAQKQVLSTLLALKQELRAPETPNAIKGLDGMEIAHKILQERQAVGLLIGGLSEAVWNQKRKVEELAARKDVDVMVVTRNFQIENPFEGGIDWWLPRSGQIEISTDAVGGYGIPVQWWENGYDVILKFGVRIHADLEPGLYIPGSDWVVSMRRTELSASLDYKKVSVEIDTDIDEAFERKMRKEGLGRALMPAVRSEFAGFILDEKYSAQDIFINLEEVDLETQAGINRLKAQTQFKAA